MEISNCQFRRSERLDFRNVPDRVLRETDTADANY